jgi:uncharacterized Zn finger protein (UPF0148 family)
MICKNCGSNTFVEKNGKMVCEYCGSEFETEKKNSTYVTQEDYDRYHRLSKIPLKYLSDEDLLWCYHQENQNDEDDEEIWLSEIEYRNLKI